MASNEQSKERGARGSEARNIFNWQYVYRNALLSFRDALLRRGRQMRVMHSHRRFTKLTDHVPQEEREKYSKCLDIDPEDHSPSLTKAFTDEILKAEKAAKETSART